MEDFIIYFCYALILWSYYNIGIYWFLLISFYLLHFIYYKLSVFIDKNNKSKFKLKCN